MEEIILSGFWGGILFIFLGGIALAIGFVGFFANVPKRSRKLHAEVDSSLNKNFNWEEWIEKERLIRVTEKTEWKNGSLGSLGEAAYEMSEYWWHLLILGAILAVIGWFLL